MKWSYCLLFSLCDDATNRVYQMPDIPSQTADGIDYEERTQNKNKTKTKTEKNLDDAVKGNDARMKSNNKRNTRVEWRGGIRSAHNEMMCHTRHGSEVK